MKKRIAFSLMVTTTLFAALLLLIGEGHVFASRGKFAQEVSTENYQLSTADGLTLTFSADGQVQSLTEDGDALPITAGPALWLRDMSQAGQVTGPNLLANPDFEDNLTGWRISQQIDTTITVTSAVHHGGDHALQMIGGESQSLTAGAISTASAIPVTPGQRYRISGYFLSSRGYVQGIMGTPPIHQDEIWRGIVRPNGLYVRWLNGSGGQVGDPTLVAPLHWNAYNWRKISGEVRAPAGASQMEVVIVGRLDDETLWVDDLNVIASPETETPVTGNVTPCENDPANCLQQVATLPESGLVLTATYTAMTDHIGVQVAVRDTTGEDRAIEVVWGLPLNLASGGSDWRWWDDVRHNRTIHAGPLADLPQFPFPTGLSWTYEHIVSGVWDGWLPISLYPYALVEDGSHGLALATSLSSPRLVKLAYDQEKGRYEARSYLGISPQATKVGPTADFSLELYRVDPEWGFRAAMDAFARRHLDWFNSPRSLSSYADYERGSYGSPEGAQQVLTDDHNNVFTAEYLVADAPLTIAPVSQPRPTYTQTVARVQEFLQSPAIAERVLAQAITRSVALADNGDWQIKRVGEFEWAMGQWQAVWYTSVDPDIDEGWGPAQWDWNVSRTLSATEAIGAVLDGVLVDNFLSVPGVDLRPEHLALTDAPLTYDASSYRPGVHNMVNNGEYLVWLRRQMRDRGRGDMAIAINFWGLATPNSLAPYVDVLGGEGESKRNPEINWNPRILDYRRAIAYHKLQSWTNGEANLSVADVQAYVAQALFYGIFPTRKETATGWESGADDVLAQAKQLQRRYAAAGWEPLTYARSGDEEVWIERFGDPPTRPAGLYFTIYNPTDITRTTTVTIETTPLGLTDPATAALTDIGITQTIPTNLANGDIRFSLTLGAHRTRIVQVNGGMQAPTPTPTPSPAPVYMPLLLKGWHRPQATRTPTSTATPTSAPTDTPTPSAAANVLIDADPAHGPGLSSPLWRPGIVWQGGGGGGSNINPALVDYWTSLGGFDRVGLVRIVPELDSISRGEYHLDDYGELVGQVRDHGGRLLVKIRTTPWEYSNTHNPPDACPPDDPSDWRYAHRYAKYGVADDKRAAYAAMIQDFIRYFSARGETVTNEELFGDNLAHSTLGMSGVLYELWDEPNYDMLWCDTEEHFLDLYQLIVEAADRLRTQDSHVLPFTIGGPGWRRHTLRNAGLPPGFGAPNCLDADDPSCGAIRRFYEELKARGYLENGHVSWWSYSYLPTESTTGATHTNLTNIHTILNDTRYGDHYAHTLIVIGEWGPPFDNARVDLLPSDSWQGERGTFFGQNINDDNEVGASLVPARIWDMTRASPPPDFQSYFQIGEWPVDDYLPLFKGTNGIMAAQALGLRKAVSNVFLLLNRLQPQELATTYQHNPMLNLVATASEDGRTLAVLSWYHPSIKPYETGDTVAYDDLLDGLARDGVGPVTVALNFEHLTPNATYTQTLSVVDGAHSNAFAYRHAVSDDLRAHCGDDPAQWQRSCVYRRMGVINGWTLAEEGASVALETTSTTLTADDEGHGRVTITLNPYSVWLVTLEKSLP